MEIRAIQYPVQESIQYINVFSDNTFRVFIFWLFFFVTVQSLILTTVK